MQQPAMPEPPDLTSLPGAERRQLTIMFCDVVGSTALAAQLDPEDLREVIADYHRSVSAVVVRFGGFVAKFMGDGALAYFGYPQAHEDDAERAIRAGLALVSTARAIPAPTNRNVQVRVGIATGLVIVGDVVGTGEAHERGVVGEAPNLAARLQVLAEPDSVVIDEATHRLAGRLFDYDDLGKVELKGFAAPVLAWRVRAEGTVASRFEALHSTAALTPLIGREEEIQLLLRRWGQAKGGEGRVILLSGEAGLGKSRLILALQEELRTEPHVLLRYFCSPHRQDSALHPVITQLEQAIGSERHDTADSKFRKLEALIAATSAPAADITLLADLLQIPADGLYAASRLSPPRRKEETFRALLRQIEAAARHHPILLTFEDVHWIDPSSNELLDRVVERATALPVLVLMTFRPTFRPSWVGHPHVTMLALSRLSRREGSMLVHQVAGEHALSADLVTEIVFRTDGVPLFLEELTKAVLETRGDKEGGRQAPAPSSVSALALPGTLHASITARLDRVGPAAKRVAQTGAAVGREFSYDLLSAVVGGTEAELRTTLVRLVTSGLVSQRGQPPESIYTFKHALVQDAAYGAMLRSDKRQLHARIAEALESNPADRPLREPEILAHHFTEAQQTGRAVGYWLRAGERDARRSANLEALGHLTRGLEALKRLPESPERDRLELKFQITLGTALIAVHGYSATETGAAYSRARYLCERLGDEEPLLATLSGEFVYHFVRGDYAMMQRLTGEAGQAAKRLSNPMIVLASHRLAGITAMYSGTFAAARSEFEDILRLYEVSQHRSQPVHYVHDPQISALTYLTIVLWLLGFPDQAHRCRQAALCSAAELDQANLTAHVHNFAGAGLDELCDDARGVATHAAAIIELSDQHSLGYWRVNGLILRGWAMVRQGATDSGLALMRENVERRAALGVSWYQSRYLCLLAGAYAQIGNPEPGLRVIADAKDLIAKSGERMWDGEAKRIEGELLRLAGGSTQQVEDLFEQAITVGREQQAKSLELRAALSLTTHWSDQGRQSDARARLAPVFRWFTEGFETADLRAAKALLAGLDR
jgi:predicted ATPase/class 3 adenylate cyclase